MVMVYSFQQRSVHLGAEAKHLRPAEAKEGFRKEELKVLYNTSRKLKVTGERQADGGQRARFLKMFPVPRSCNAGAIRAVMDKEEALLYVILPKGSSSSSSSPPSNSSMDKQKDDQNVSSEPQGGAAMADGSSSSSSSSGVLYSAQEDEEMGRMDDEKVVEREEQIATQDVPGTTHGDDVNGGNRRLLHLGVLAGLETAVRVHPKDVGVEHGKHLVDAVGDLLGGGDSGGVDVVHTRANASSVLDALTEDGQELLVGPGVLDGDHIGVHVDDGVDDVVEVRVAHVSVDLEGKLRPVRSDAYERSIPRYVSVLRR
uniref:SHSP domain-containing protein n=1 Tax=Oryza brachyantha TaxID=4533 RepID=J3LR98_ORYBR